MDAVPVAPARSNATESRGAIALSEDDRMRLADIIEASHRVVKRYQFYLWDQGPVQSLLPHDILICGVANGAEVGLHFHRFCVTRYFRQEHFDVVCEPRHGLMTQAIALWRRSGDPIFVAPGGPPVGDHEEMIKPISDNELRNLAAHRGPGSEGGA